MFKFAANKFTGGNFTSSSNQNNNNSSATTQSNVSSSISQANKSHPGTADDGGGQLATGPYSTNTNARRRCQIQKDLFSFNKIADKGFPSKPSAMDYDKKLKLLAIGTKNGDIRIYGEPNTLSQQLSCYQDVHPFPILKLLFVQGQYQLITLSERVYRNDMTNKGESHFYLILWQIPNLNQFEQQTATSTANGTSTSTANSSLNLVEKIKEYQLEPKIVNNTRLSALTLLNDNSHLFIGFETGDVYVFNVSTFQMVPGVINKDYIIKNLPPAPTTSSAEGQAATSNKKLTTLGAVESICHHPRQLTKLLIAYQRGLWIIFDFIKNQIEQINQTQQQLESAVFYQHGECVATSHSDGSFILWDLSSAVPIATTTGDSSSPAATAAASGPSSCSSSSAPNIVYGPYPCKAVNKCLVKTCRNDQPYVIFSGGCPRVNYSDKITITVIQGENSHVCFDFTSKIIEFFTIDKPSIEKQTANSSSTTTTTTATSNNPQTIIYDNPQALFVLLEEEFVAIDLVSENWPQYKLPYLCSVHSSAIICTHYANNVSKQSFERLKYYGTLAQDVSEVYSDREWPIGGGSSGVSSLNNNNPDKRDLLLTGHEDGSVRFWDVTNMSMTLIYRLKTSEYFQTDSTPMSSADEQQADLNSTNDLDNWPPFRKVGTFDPYSDDPKLGIQKIFLCPKREIIVLAGTAGQVLIMNLNEQARDVSYNSIESHKINIIGVSPEVESHFVWKGHEPLATRGQLGHQQTPLTGSLKLLPGYQLHSLIQLYPPATVSALALNTDWQLVAMGTSHGFALFDYAQGKDLLIRCTLDPAMLLAANNPNDSGNAGTTISRRKSLKKSLRESFRKLRRGRSQKPAGNNKLIKHNEMLTASGNTPSALKSMNEEDLNDHHKPIERQVESREFKPVDDIPPSVIRYMYFVRTYITSSQQQTNSLWVGTNTGIIYIYALQFLLNSSNASALLPDPPRSSKVTSPTALNAVSCTLRTNQMVNCVLAKEMRLKHRAPVVHIQVIDQNMNPLPSDSSTGGVNEQDAVISGVNHKVIICSEEQFKVFQLPTLKPVCKFKLTAVEGARVRRIGYNCYISKNDSKYSEYCLSCLSNLGDISVYSLPNLKRQVQIQCMKQQDINAITSFVFSKQGQAFYLQSASEFVHISMSARDSPQQIHLNMTNQRHSQTPVASAVKSQTAAKSIKQTTTPVASVATTETKQPQPAAKLASPPAAPISSTSEATPVQANSQLSSPKSPPPPVPAPRTTIASSVVKEDTNRNETKSNYNNNSETVTIPAVEKDSEKSMIELNEKLNEVILSVNTEQADEPLGSAMATVTADKSISSVSISSPNKTPNSKSTNEDKIGPKGSPNTPVNDLANSSVLTNLALTSTSTLAFLNQSNISSINNVTSTLNHNGGGIGVNYSMSNGGDSFNVSSSGYNGSSSYVLNTSNTFNLSMDSVVDKFSDEFNHVLSKKIPSSIEEDRMNGGGGNDSLLNESQISRVQVNGHSRCSNEFENLNGSVKEKTADLSLLNGCASTNGTENGYDKVHSPSAHQNGHSLAAAAAATTNGANENHLELTSNKKTSSPLTKLNGHAQNGHALNIEQVTKRIENGSKLEYRETAID